MATALLKKRNSESFSNGAPSSSNISSATPNKLSVAMRPTTSLEPNISHVVLGDLLIKSWYPSFYPEELVGRSRLERLYVCQWCFKYSREVMPFVGHVKACPLKEEEPPGDCIYKKGEYEIWEVDGEEYKLYCQNLCLFAKLFLDTKSVFFDVTTFLYYLLVHRPPPNPEAPSTNTEQSKPQVVGFFSKEKMSWDNNNLACILVFPPWQRKGLGQVLMGVSYELSKREGRLGGPEKPLSSLGRLAYVSFWSHTLARIFLSSSTSLSVCDLSNETFILPDDIVQTLQSMQVIEHRPSRRNGKTNNEDGNEDEVVTSKRKLTEWAQKHKVNMTPPVDVKGFVGKEEEE